MWRGAGGRWGVGGGEASWRGRIKDVEGCGVTLPHCPTPPPPSCV
jgi:hypothetical protein